jgi:hypothetical protein
VVATWNRGKGPIDVYSRFQKNTKSSHAHLGPIGAIWLRLVMTTVYNAYHSFNLSRTAAFLASAECRSFKEFQKTRARLPPFRQFCHMLAEDLRVDVVPPIMYQSSSSDEDDEFVVMPGTSDDDGEVETQRTRQTRNNASEMVSIAYNKRDAYFSMPELIAKRMTRSILVRCGDNQVVFGAVAWITPEEGNTADTEGRRRGTVPFVKSHCAKSGGTTISVALNFFTLLTNYLTRAVFRHSN